MVNEMKTFLIAILVSAAGFAAAEAVSVSANEQPSIDGFIRDVPATLWYVDGRCFIALSFGTDSTISFTVTIPNKWCSETLGVR